jgi:hypothetical protein
MSFRNLSSRRKKMNSPSSRSWITTKMCSLNAKLISNSYPQIRRRRKLNPSRKAITCLLTDLNLSYQVTLKKSPRSTNNSRR